MPNQALDIFSYYNVQRFIQFGSKDCANWYNIDVPDTKLGKALYPAMGRQHIEFLNEVKLVFSAQPKEIYRSVNFYYIFVETRVYQVDKSYNTIELELPISLEGKIWFSFLSVGTTTYCMFTDSVDVFVITESPTTPVTIQKTSPGGNTPVSPGYITALGNRFIVSSLETPYFYNSAINLAPTPTDPSTWFTVDGSQSFGQASGIIRQLCTLNNQLFIFTDFNVDIWSNIVTQFVVGETITTFPFKLNTATNFNCGIADPESLSIDFGMMVWLAKNASGLITFVKSDGGQPETISTQAINVLLTNTSSNGFKPFLSQNSSGFLYQWENTIFYRIIAGTMLQFGNLDLQDSRNALEYNFDTQKWHRVIELDGSRNRISKHTFFSNTHLVIVENETAIYEMAGNIYTNEVQTADDKSVFTKLPMRYELKTSQIFNEDYSEIETEYVEIDFVYGYDLLPRSDAPFLNTVYITDEEGNYIVTEGSTEGTQTLLIQEGTNTPTLEDQHFNDLFNAHVELYFSDDGGITFNSADVRLFGYMGSYTWRMRWYQLGVSRNRVYKLVCVSGSPIVILGARQQINRASGGAN